MRFFFFKIFKFPDFFQIFFWILKFFLESLISTLQLISVYSAHEVGLKDLSLVLFKRIKTALELFVAIPNDRLPTNFQLDVFIFEARASIKTLLQSLKQCLPGKGIAQIILYSVTKVCVERKYCTSHLPDLYWCDETWYIHVQIMLNDKYRKRGKNLL